MSQLIWSPSALQDVQRLYRFLARKNHEAARRAVAQIRKSMQELAGNPTMGRSVDDMPAAFREWLIDFGDSGYVARYRLDDANITVLAICHQKEAGF